MLSVLLMAVPLSYHWAGTPAHPRAGENIDPNSSVLRVQGSGLRLSSADSPRSRSLHPSYLSVRNMFRFLARNLQISQYLTALFAVYVLHLYIGYGLGTLIAGFNIGSIIQIWLREIRRPANCPESATGDCSHNVRISSRIVEQHLNASWPETVKPVPGESRYNAQDEGAQERLDSGGTRGDTVAAQGRNPPGVDICRRQAEGSGIRRSRERD